MHCLNLRSVGPPLCHLIVALRLFSSIPATVQVLLEEGPTTYSLGDLRDATKLAQKIVQSYGMTDMGITMHAPKQRGLGFMKRSFEVSLIPVGCAKWPRMVDMGFFGAGAWYQAIVSNCTCETQHGQRVQGKKGGRIVEFICLVGLRGFKCCDFYLLLSLKGILH